MNIIKKRKVGIDLIVKKYKTTNDILILDGISGTGKTMLGPVLGSFKNVTNGKFDYNFEYISILNFLNNLGEEDASGILNYIIDNNIYSDSIGRELNFRLRDLSSVINLSNGLTSIVKIFSSDSDELYQNKLKMNKTFIIWTHQLVAAFPLLEAAFDTRLKIIESVRHPLYLFDHWIHQEWWDNSKNPNLQNFNGNQEIFWFLENDHYDYNQRSSADKAVINLISLYKHVFKFLKSEKIMYVPFEHFVLNTSDYVKKIESFIQRPRGSYTKLVLKQQRLPRLHINNGVKKSIYLKYGAGNLTTEKNHQTDYENNYHRIQRVVSQDLWHQFENLIAEYEKEFGLWF